jgi:hypothetical protein
MAKADKTFPLTAHLVAQELEGAVTNNGTDYPFTAELDGDKLSLHSGQKTHVLTRQAAPPGAGTN